MQPGYTMEALPDFHEVAALVRRAQGRELSSHSTYYYSPAASVQAGVPGLRYCYAESDLPQGKSRKHIVLGAAPGGEQSLLTTRPKTSQLVSRALLFGTVVHRVHKHGTRL